MACDLGQTGHSLVSAEQEAADGGGRETLLSKERESSTIPRSADSFWKYPSPSQFHSALSRKHMPVDPSAVPTLLSIHNHLNELVWRHILSDWEYKYHRHRHCNEGDGCVVLKRFRGRPGQWSPLAWWYWLRHGVMPFDRHDWIVERRTTDDNGNSAGKELRYVIDYYESGGEFSCVIRPAIDSLGALMDRIRSLLTK